MRVELTNPLALLLLMLVPIAHYLSRGRNPFARKLTGPVSRSRMIAIVAARSIIVVLLVLAAAGLRVRTRSRDLAIIFLIDVSTSMARDLRQPSQARDVIEMINRQIDIAEPKDYIGVIAFAREPSVELSPTRKEALAGWRLTELHSNPPRDYTDIAAALRLASALVPESATGRFVLVSDGAENLETAARILPLLRSQGVEVHTAAMRSIGDGRSRAEAAVRDLAAPARLAEGEAFELKATIDSTRETDAKLRVFSNDSLITERTVRLSAAGDNVFILPQRVEQKGFYTYRAEIEAIGADSMVQNNSREALVMVDGGPKALYLFGDPRPSPALSRVLADAKIETKARPAGGTPSTLAGFQDYDLVILDNVPATALTQDQMKMIRAYVHDLGGGFIMIGGDKSFGAGGYYKTPMEDVLPVSLDIRNKKHFPALALVLVIDQSGSMNEDQLGRRKIELAIEASSAAVEALSERDSAGVIAFESSPHAIVNLERVDDKKAIEKKIGEITAAGGTAMYPALEMAYGWLAASDAQMKHIIVLSDGESDPGDFPAIARAIRNAGMTLSSVAVGEQADFALMDMLARTGGGRFYATTRPETLTSIFTREAFLASGGSIIEEPFVPLLEHSSPATNGIDWSQAPRLLGYAGTSEREPKEKGGPAPAVTSLISDKSDPIYSVWQYGLGRSAAFTSDAKPRWAAEWMRWPGFGQFWTQMIRDTIRRADAGNGLRLETRLDFGIGHEPSRSVSPARSGHISVEASTPDGQFKNGLALHAHVIGPDLTSVDVPLHQTSAGRYEAAFPALAKGAYIASILDESGEQLSIPGGVKSYSAEYGIVPGDAALLAQIREATGGKAISVSDLVTDSPQPTGVTAEETPGALKEIDARSVDLFRDRKTKTAPHEIWERLLLLALLLLPIDVGLRRVHVTREDVRSAFRGVASTARASLAVVLGRAVPVGPDVANESLGKLKASRSRVRLGRETTDGGEIRNVHVRSGVTPVQAGKPGVVDPTGPRTDATLPVRSYAKEADGGLAARLLEAKRNRRE